MFPYRSRLAKDAMHLLDRPRESARRARDYDARAKGTSFGGYFLSLRQFEFASANGEGEGAEFVFWLR